MCQSLVAVKPVECHLLSRVCNRNQNTCEMQTKVTCSSKKVMQTVIQCINLLRNRLGKRFHNQKII